jgi:hypothetical protein
VTRGLQAISSPSCLRWTLLACDTESYGRCVEY